MFSDKTRTDFSTDKEYSEYVFTHVKPGMTVRTMIDVGLLKPGVIGVVTRTVKDWRWPGDHRVYAHWQGYVGESCIYCHWVDIVE